MRVRINEPHPTALAKLSPDLRDYAVRMCDAGKRRISLRTFMAYDQLRKQLGDEKASRVIFADRAQDIIDAIKVDKVL